MTVDRGDIRVPRFATSALDAQLLPNLMAFANVRLLGRVIAVLKGISNTSRSNNRVITHGAKSCGSCRVIPWLNYFYQLMWKFDRRISASSKL